MNVAPLPLPFLRDIAANVFTDDALNMTGRGLGLFKVIVSLLGIYADRSSTLLLLVNFNDDDIKIANRLLNSSDTTKTGPIVEVDSDMPLNQRLAFYNTGGMLAVTTRILVVDLLTEKIPAHLISGMIIHHAHRINELSNEAFIIKLYREKNKEGFIKAFSESPESFISGFATLEKYLRTLHLKKVFLWPRFHMTISEDLNTARIDLVELVVPMSSRVRRIQTAIVEIIDACLSEIRRSHPFLDEVDLSVESALFKHFDRHIRLFLEPIWHRVSLKQKQLIRDLSMLRKLLEYLHAYDCVTFLTFLETVVMAECAGSKNGMTTYTSPWVFMDAVDTLLKVARERVYKIQSRPHQITNEPVQSVVPELEENPKWAVLKTILSEIEGEVKNYKEGNEKYPISSGPVLIMVNDVKTRYQLRDFLLLDSNHNINETTKRHHPTLFKAWESYRRWNKTLNGTLRSFGPTIATISSVTANQPPPKRQRRVRGGGTTAASTSGRTLGIDAQVSRLEAFLANAENGDEEIPDINVTSQDSEDEFDASTLDASFGLICPSSSQIHIRIVPYGHGDSNSDDILLDELVPRFVIMYDPNPSFIRRLEVYKASRDGLPLRVYFMMAENSAEEQKYLTSIRREKEAFEKLIRDKAGMAVRNDQDGKSTVTNHANSAPVSNFRNPNIHHHSKPQEGQNLILVDMREFRSPLSFVLHNAGFIIQPLTLEIGDYVLSPTMCVERKSIPDLVSSLNSGRLYTQTEAMCRHYETPILLIEYDGGRPFSLQTLSQSSSNMMQTVSGKLTLLSLHFPRLRIIWSSSLYATADIFIDLKAKQPNPDPETASSLALDSNKSGLGVTTNYVPMEMLRKIPGITSVSARYIVQAGIKNIKMLTEATKEDICASLQHENRGNEAYTFIHHKINTQ